MANVGGVNYLDPSMLRRGQPTAPSNFAAAGGDIVDSIGKIIENKGKEERRKKAEEGLAKVTDSISKNPGYELTPKQMIELSVFAGAEVAQHFGNWSKEMAAFMREGKKEEAAQSLEMAQRTTQTISEISHAMRQVPEQNRGEDLLGRLAEPLNTQTLRPILLSVARAFNDGDYSDAKLDSYIAAGVVAGQIGEHYQARLDNESKERIAATEAAGGVQEAKIKAQADVEVAEVEGQTDRDVATTKELGATERAERKNDVDKEIERIRATAPAFREGAITDLAVRLRQEFGGDAFAWSIYVRDNFDDVDIDDDGNAVHIPTGKKLNFGDFPLTKAELQKKATRPPVNPNAGQKGSPTMLYSRDRLRAGQ